MNYDNMAYFPSDNPEGQHQGEQSPWWKNSRRLGLIGGLVVLVLVLILAGWYGYNVWQVKHEGVSINEAQEMVNAELAACANDADPEICEARVRNGIAKSTGRVEVCGDAQDEGYTSCVRLAARDAGDADLCASLEESDRVSCEDAAIQQSARTTANYALCDSLATEARVTACQQQVRLLVWQAGTCATYGIEAWCVARDARYAAVAIGDAASCEVIADEEERNGCVSDIDRIDRDDDGLSRGREFELGTSDDSADTDGDGYNDGQEVSSGYDPLS